MKKLTTGRLLIAFFICLSISLASGVDANAETCTKDEIDNYLKRGFTSEEIKKFCKDTFSDDPMCCCEKTYHDPAGQLPTDKQVKWIKSSNCIGKPFSKCVEPMTCGR
jgi:hypothetical protein